MKMKPLLIFKMIIFFILFLGAFYILEYGTVWDSINKFPRPIFLSGFTVFMLFHPKFKRQVFIFSIICLILMILTSIFGWLDLSSTIGSFGFSLLIVTLCLYIPQIIKKGQIDKF